MEGKERERKERSSNNTTPLSCFEEDSLTSWPSLNPTSSPNISTCTHCGKNEGILDISSCSLCILDILSPLIKCEFCGRTELQGCMKRTMGSCPSLASNEAQQSSRSNPRCKNCGLLRSQGCSGGTGRGKCIYSTHKSPKSSKDTSFRSRGNPRCKQCGMTRLMGCPGGKAIIILGTGRGTCNQMSNINESRA